MEFEAKKAEYVAWLRKRDDAMRQAAESVVAIYARMRPDAAALQIAAMDDAMAAAILTKLPARAAGAILNEMEAGRAARLTRAMAGLDATCRREEVVNEISRLLSSLRVALGGCAGDIREIGREPAMSPVGTGLIADVQPSASAVFLPSGRSNPQSIWNGGRADIFSDPRAAKIGDVVTVNIAINDSATFGNATDRSLNSQVNTGFDWKLGVNNTDHRIQTRVHLRARCLRRKGQGTTDRSEKIQLSVAAVVTDVLPNGNLVVSGSQEVRVNFELRLLNVAGIVRPRDISKENTISYDKVAEARISYGGRGRIMEVQQPAWGQQIYDWFKPL